MARMAFVDKALSEQAEVEDFLDRVGAKLCNCAGCGKDLLSIQSKLDILCNTEARRLKRLLPEGVAGRVNTRPYCSGCLNMWR